MTIWDVFPRSQTVTTIICFCCRGYLYSPYLLLLSKWPDILQQEENHGKYMKILLIEEILHQLIGSLFQNVQGFMHPRWCRISSINSIASPLCMDVWGTSISKISMLYPSHPAVKGTSSHACRILQNGPSPWNGFRSSKFSNNLQRTTLKERPFRCEKFPVRHLFAAIFFGNILVKL